MAEGYADLSYMSEKRTPITASIYYFDRWKIMQAKLLLNDLKYLAEKHNIIAAQELYFTVQYETDQLCMTLDKIIRTKQDKRTKYAEKETTIQRHKQT